MDTGLHGFEMAVSGGCTTKQPRYLLRFLTGVAALRCSQLQSLPEHLQPSLGA
jgi:hypothetical protein